MLQVAIVGQPRLWIEVESDLNVFILDLQSLGESRQAS